MNKWLRRALALPVLTALVATVALTVPAVAPANAIVELERHAIDATRTGRGFRYINHSCDPNTFTRCTDERAEFYALRDIRRGEELTVDYGDSHHDGKLRCRCGARNCRGFI